MSERFRAAPLTRRSLGGLAAGAMALRTMGARAETNSVLTITIPEDPATLDPSTNTINVTAIIDQNIFETLYAFDANWHIRPMLAAAMPDFADGGRTVRIPLRQGVMFHDGSTMSSADVLASLKRWHALSVRGKLAGQFVESLSAPGPSTIEYRLKTPYAPLLPMLSFFNAAAAIMPEAVAQRTIGGPMKDMSGFIGTGPYRMLERKPDQYVRLTRFEKYSALDSPASGYAGHRQAMVKELRFVPVPNPATRVDGLLAGQYDVADNLSTSAYDRIANNPAVEPLIVKYSGWILMIMNSRQGIAANPKLRQAVQAAIDPEAMLLAGFDSPRFFATSPSMYPKGTEFYSTNGAELYAQKNPARARKLLAEAGYKGEPFRIITGQQYDFIYKAVLVAAQSMRDAGINVDVQLMDWASVMEQRYNPAIWDGFLTFHNFVPEPTLAIFFNPSFPGWWNTPEKREAVDAFTSTLDPKQRAAAWDEVQGVLMRDAQTLVIGSYYALSGYSRKVHGMQPFLQPPYWNVSLS